MQHGELPADLSLHRVTNEFSADSVPTGLLRAHHLAAGVWGLLRVTAGSLAFVWEDASSPPIELLTEDSVVIAPELQHHVEPAPDARFVVEFYR